MMTPTGRVQQVKQEISKPVAGKIEDNPWFWNPGLYGIRREPSDFRKKLDDMGHPDIAVCWNPVNERWQVYCKAPRVDNPICRGWRYLFPVQLADRSYAPLDERTLAKIVSISADVNGNGLKYFERVASEMARDKANATKREEQDTFDSAGEFFDYTKPKVGYGAISSSKVVGQ
jgi:hypothetical protein